MSRIISLYLDCLDEIKRRCNLSAESSVESRDQSLGKPEGENKLGSGHEKLLGGYCQLGNTAEQIMMGSRTLGTSPLKKLEKPSCLAMLLRIRKPLSGLSKLRFWIRVLITSRGAETTSEAVAPAIEAMKFWNQVALL